MDTDREQGAEIRRRVLVEQVSQRQILRETGMHWKTLQKILAHSEPPGYRRDVPFSKPKIGPFGDGLPPSPFLLAARSAGLVASDRSWKRTVAFRKNSGIRPSGSSSGSSRKATRAATRK